MPAVLVRMDRYRAVSSASTNAYREVVSRGQSARIVVVVGSHGMPGENSHA